MHVDHVKKPFAQKVSALKRMKELPVKVLEEIYFKSIVLAVNYGIYGIMVRGNRSYLIIDSLILFKRELNELFISLKS